MSETARASAPVAVRLYLQPGVGNSYHVQMYLNIPANEELELTTDEPVPVQFDADGLRQRQADPAAYGQLLGTLLFDAAVLREGLQQAQRVAARLSLPLRVEIDLSRRAAELQQIKWHHLRDPADGQPLDAVLLEALPPPPPPDVSAETVEEEPAINLERAPDPRITEALLLLGFLVMVGSLCPFFLGLVTWFDIGVFGDEVGPVLGIAFRVYMFFFVLLLLAGAWILRIGIKRDADYRRIKNITVSPRSGDWGS